MIQFLFLYLVLLFESIGFLFLHRSVFLVNFHFLDKVLVISITFVDILIKFCIFNVCYQLLDHLTWYLLSQQVLDQHFIRWWTEEIGFRVVCNTMTVAWWCGHFKLFFWWFFVNWLKICWFFLFLAWIDINELLFHFQNITVILPYKVIKKVKKLFTTNSH